MISDPTTVSGTLDGGFDGTGVVAGVAFSTPDIEFEQVVGGIGSDLIVEVVASFSQPSSGSGTVVVQDDGRAAVAVDVSLALRLDLDVGNGSIVTTCRSQPIALELRSPASSPYDPETGLVTVTDPQFTIPPVAASQECNALVVSSVNEQLAGADNSITLTLRGDLDLPPPPGEPTTTTVVAAANPTFLGHPATFTATVAPGEDVEGEDPTGSVEFFLNGDQSLGQAPVGASGQAALTTSTLPDGTHEVTARYLGDPVFSGSQSAPLSHTVDATPNLTATVPAELVAGAPAEDTEFTAVIANPASAGPLPNLRVDVRFGTLASMANGHLVLAYESAPDVWTPVALTGTTVQTGSYGGPTGFSLPAGQAREVTFRLSAIATARQGILPVQITLTSVDPVSGAVVTTLTTTTTTTHIVPAERRTTTTTLEAAPGGPGLETRQGYSLGLRATIARGGATPLPSLTGCAEIFIDGRRTATGNSSGDPDAFPATCRVPSSVGTVFFYLPRAVTRDLAPGVHIAQVSFPGDGFYQPSVSVEVAFTVLTQPTATPYQCVTTILGQPGVFGARVAFGGQVPTSAPAGSEVEVDRLTLQMVAEGSTSWTNLVALFTSAGPANQATNIDVAGQPGAGAFATLTLAGTGNLERTVTLGGIDLAVPVTGAPGEVVEATLDGFGFTTTVGASSLPLTCTPVAAPVSFGSVTVAGTTLAADRLSMVAGDAVTLTAGVFPASAQGQVEFLDGEASLGIAPIVNGAASLRTRALPEGQRSITARHLGDLVSPPTTSEPVTVAVRAIDCGAFAQPGNGAVVRLVYLELLRRCPDEAGFTFWQGQLDAGTPPATFARAIASTPEAVGHVVDNGYRTMLGRAADPAGRSYWTDRLIGHGRYDQLLADLAASGEFWNLAGGTDEGFVTRVYDRLLGRAPDQPGLDYWTSRLAAGTAPGTLVRTLANQDEPLGVLVADSYAATLDRAPDTAERSDGIAFLRATGDRSGLDAQLIGTPEFTQRAQGFPNRTG